jgi:hypothetical protein
MGTVKRKNNSNAFINSKEYPVPRPLINGGSIPFSNTKSLAFDGVDEYVDLSQQNLGTTSTISLWLKNPSIKGAVQETLLGNPLNTFNQFLNVDWNTGKMFYKDSSNNRVEWNTLATINDTNWNNIIITRSGATVTLYFNGVSQGTGTSFGTLGDTEFKYLGINFNTNTQAFNGNIDELSAFNSVLTTDQISTISTAPNDLTSLGPVVWYRMGDNSTYQTPQILMPENTNKNKFSNWSLEFDGVDDKISTGINTGTNDVTICCWIKTTSTYAYTLTQCAFGGRNAASGDNYTLGRLGSDFSTPNDTVVRVFNTLGTTKLNDGNWHFIAYTHDYTTKETKAYVDGNTTPEATATFPGFSTGFGISIGNNSLGFYFAGNVDECAYFNSVLTGSELNSIYNSGEPTTITGSTAYWKVGEQAKFTDNWLVPNSALSNYSNYSFNFDGVDDFVSIYDGTSGAGPIQFTASDDFSISAWIKTSSLSSTNYILSFRGTPLIWFYTFSTSGNIRANLYLRDNSSNVVTISTFNNSTGWIAADTWTNVIVTRNGTTKELNIYLNGTQAQTTTTDTTTDDFTLYDKLSIGNDNYFGGRYWYEGQIDEVAIFDSVVDVASVYNSGTPTTISGALAHWRMGEDATYNSSTSQWTIPDQAGSNDGTSSNTMALNTLVGEAPNYFGGGVSDAMTIEDRVGDAPNSSNNSVSFNMESTDIDNNTP